MLRHLGLNSGNIKKLCSTIVILCDTNEQKNDHITSQFRLHNIEFKKFNLDFCDYSFMLPKNEQYGILQDIYFNKAIAIERKNSIDELAGNFCDKERDDARQRFTDEFCRGLYHGCKMIICVEDGKYKNIFEDKKRSQMNTNSFVGSLYAFKHRFNLDINFCEKDYMWKHIYSTFYYYLRSLL